MSRRIVKKLVSFGNNKRDFEVITKELTDGWYIASIKQHGDAFLCVLEKDADQVSPTNISSLKLQDILPKTRANRKSKVLQES